jgi:uncharacterized membrane protein
VRRLRGLSGDEGERGQITVLILGMFLLVTTLVIGGIDVTAVQLARIRLLDAADAAALDAADSIDERAAYEQGVGEAVTLTDATVWSEAATELGRQQRPVGVEEWALAPGTGTPDGHTAVVRLTGRVQLPLVGGVLEQFGGGVTVTVESRARATLD